MALAGALSGAAWGQDAAPAEAPAASAAAPAPAQAASAPLRLSLELREGVTNNGGLDDAGMRRGDFITSLRPALEVAHVGAGLNASLQASTTLVDYARGTQPDSALPDVRGAIGAAFGGHLFRLDATGYLRAAQADPFGARTDDLTSANRRNEWGVVAGPSLQVDVSPQTTLVARHRFGATRGSTDGSGDDARLDSNLSVLRIERKPEPLGLAAELTRLDNRGSGAAGSSHYTLTTGRLRGTLRLGGEASVGALLGQDRSDYLLSSYVDPLYGATLEWSPGPRTHLEVDVEHRYFGQSGLLHLDHRTPFLSIALDLRREPVDATSSLGSLAQGTDLRSALDAILTTRYPDPAARAGVVDGIVSSRGLAGQTTGAVNLLGDYPQLQTSARASLTLLGSRDTLNLSAYSLTTRVLTRDGDPLAGLSSSTPADTRQRGVSLQLEHRLGAQLVAGLLGNWSRIESLSVSTDRSTELSWRLSLLDHLSRRSDLTVALQGYRFQTTAAGQNSFDATLGLVGLSHRF